MHEFLHIAWATFLAVFFLGGSIFVHELGHYLAARKRGLKVECFSIGFGPKLFSWKIDGVEWCISLFPLGGYVALPQLASMEGIEGEYKSEAEKLPPISYADTVIVAVMGVVFNMIFAFLLASILWMVGIPTTDAQKTTVIGTVLQTIPAEKAEIPAPGALAGFKSGDKILTIDGNAVHDWRDVKQLIVTSLDRDEKGSPKLTMEIEREGKKMTIVGSPILAGAERLRSMGLLPEEELFVGQIYKNSPAQKAGIKIGDQILAVSGAAIHSYHDYATKLEEIGAKPLELKVLRAGKELSFNMTPEKVKIDKAGDTQEMIGVELEPKVIIEHPDPFTQIASAASLTWRTLSTLVHPNSDIKVSHLSGPPGIAWLIYRLSQDIRQVMSLVVIINVNLAILNLLPMPVLDGGHITIATINRFRKKPISPEYIATLQNIFTILLLGLMAYVILFADGPRLTREIKQSAAEKKLEKSLIAPEFGTTIK